MPQQYRLESIEIKIKIVAHLLEHFKWLGSMRMDITTPPIYWKKRKGMVIPCLLYLY